MSSSFTRTASPAQRAVAEDLGPRRRDAAHLAQAEARVDEQPLEAAEGEQPRVGAVQDPRVAVVELPEQQHQPLGGERDVRRGEHQRPGPVVELVDELLEELLGVLQVLDHVEHQQVVVLAGVEDRRVVEVLLEDLDVAGRVRGRELVDDRDLAALRHQLLGHPAGAGADVEHAAARGHGVERELVAARVAELDVVVAVRVAVRHRARSGAG